MGSTGRALGLCAVVAAIGCGNAVKPPADLGPVGGDDLAGVQSGDDLAGGADLAVVASAAHSTVVIAPASVAANGTSSATITVTVADANGVPIPAQAVALAVSGSANTLGATSGSTDASGVFTAT